jgi:hypothetical protein
MSGIIFMYDGTRNIVELIGGSQDSKDPAQIDIIDRFSIGVVTASCSRMLENGAPPFGPHITTIENRRE